MALERDSAIFTKGDEPESKRPTNSEQGENMAMVDGFYSKDLGIKTPPSS
jgi:hypothetical protein